VTYSSAATPEPTTIFLTGFGLIAIAAGRNRARRLLRR
jgi:hypothetical protein